MIVCDCCGMRGNSRGLGLSFMGSLRWRCDGAMCGLLLHREVDFLGFCDDIQRVLFLLLPLYFSSASIQ